MRRRALTLLAAVSMIVGVFALPAPAAIHELVGSHCNGFHDPETAPNGGKNLDPPGQVRLGEQSFLRALLATGIYDDPIFGEDPDGNPGPFVTIVVNDHPANKFTWDGTSYMSFTVPELGITAFIPDIEADHPSLENCHNLQGGHD